MTEVRARYISLIIIAIEAILIVLSIGGIAIIFELLDYITSYNYYNNMESFFPEVVFLLIFLGIGVLIILSAFYKIPFYIITILEIILSTFLIVSSEADIFGLLICAGILLPQFFYYSVFVYIYIREKNGVKK